MNHKNSNFSLDSRLGINKTARLIYVPNDIEDEIVQDFIDSINLKEKKKIDENEKEQEIINDYFYCCEETAVLSCLQKPLYQKTGSVKMLNYCVTCAYDAFKNSVERLFDQEEDKPIMDILCENTEKIDFIDLLSNFTDEACPEIPLGQLL